MALSLNSVTPTGHITIIIYWCVGIFNIRGLTFGHGLGSWVAGLVGSSCHIAMLMLVMTLLDVIKAEFVSECQT